MSTPIRTYGFFAITGNTPGAMDEVSGTALNNNDRALVLADGFFAAYVFDEDNGGTHNGTSIVQPASEPGDGRWIRVTLAGIEPEIDPKNTAFNKNFGTSVDTVCEGDDSRLSNDRDPTAHKARHGSTGSDALSPADIGAATSGHNHSGTYLESESDPVVGAITGIVKANGAGTISAAVSGTDYESALGNPSVDGMLLSGMISGDRPWVSALVEVDGSDGTKIVGDKTLIAKTKHIVKSATGAIATADTFGTIVNNYGQDNDTLLTLPDAVSGLSFSLICGTTVAKYFRLKPGANDKIYLDGVPGGDGEYIGLATVAAGDALSAKTFQTGATRYDWFIVAVRGTWTAESI